MAVRTPGRRTACLVGLTAALVLGGCGTPVTTTTGDPSTEAPSAPASSSVPTESPISSSTAASPSLSPTPPSATPTPPKPTAPAQPAAMLQKGDSGEKVRELQHRLRQLDWYAGSITGDYATSTVTGVKGFQDKRKLTATGAVDTTTWTKLVAMTRTPTSDEKHNRLVPGPAIMKQGSDSRQVRILQSRLKQIGWFAGNVTDHYGSATVAAVKGFQAKRAIPVTGAVDQRTWDRLLAMTRTPTADELANKAPKPTPVGHLDPRCLTGRAICISKSTDTLVWVVDGQQRFRASVRFGSELTPTREGSFSVGWKSRNHVSTIYHTPMPFAMFFSGGQAVHYSADFAARGYNGASHGCVNVRDYNGIASLFDQVRVGDKVIVYR